MTQDDVIKLVQDSPLEVADKEAWIARIREEKLTQDVLDELRAFVQGAIDAEFDALGIRAEDNPEFAAQQQAMTEEVEAAGVDFQAAMQQLNQQIAAMQADAGKQVDDLMAQSVKDAIA